MKVNKLTAVIPVADELLEDPLVNLWAAMLESMNTRAEERERWRKKAAEKRAGQRQASRVELTLDALIDKLGWSREYAEHFVQPYCECDADMDGWSYCEHARDEGLVP